MQVLVQILSKTKYELTISMYYCINVMIMCIITVSYTHLDVYKRQPNTHVTRFLTCFKRKNFIAYYYSLLIRYFAFYSLDLITNH